MSTYFVLSSFGVADYINWTREIMTSNDSANAMAAQTRMAAQIAECMLHHYFYYMYVIAPAWQCAQKWITMPRIVFTLKFGLKLKVQRSCSFGYRDSGFGNGYTSYVNEFSSRYLAETYIFRSFFQNVGLILPFFPCLWILKPMNGGKFINEINFFRLFHVSCFIKLCYHRAKWVVNYAHKIQQSVVSFYFNAFTVVPHSCFEWLTKN